jgi:hypothetical protein
MKWSRLRQQPEHRQNSVRFEQEQFCSALTDKYYIRRVPITEYVYSDQRLREGIPVVAVSLSKRKCRCEIWNEAQSLKDGWQ